MDVVTELQHRTAQWILDRTDPDTGLTPDRSPRDPAGPDNPTASIAAMGFALPSYAIAAEHGWTTRDDALTRTRATLRTLEGHDHHGFFFHFLDAGVQRAHHCELSSVDTTLLLGGVIFAGEFWDDAEVRERASALVDAVDWPFLMRPDGMVGMGWTPETGFIEASWRGYNEAMLTSLLALGSSTHPAPDDLWQRWCSGYDRSWGDFEGQVHLGFGPMFGHQYSHVFVDFRGIRDQFCREHDLDYAENSRRATLSQQAYAVHNPGAWEGYSETLWGLTASDDPDGYAAHGCGLIDHFDNGTLTPTAVAASLPFAPDLVTTTLERLVSGRATGVESIDAGLYGPHGLADAFHVGRGWLADDLIGIDQGPIVCMVENHRSGMVWEVMRRSGVLRRGLERAGFTGGWL